MPQPTLARSAPKVLTVTLRVPLPVPLVLPVRPLPVPEAARRGVATDVCHLISISLSIDGELCIIKSK